MIRDMDMVRDILIAVEQKATPEGVLMDKFEVAGHPDISERRKHFTLLAEAGFFMCEPFRSTSNPDRIYGVCVFDLSWKGHEYLDTIRDPIVWKKTKSGMKKIGGGSFDLALEIAKGIAKSALRDAGIAIA